MRGSQREQKTNVNGNMSPKEVPSTNVGMLRKAALQRPSRNRIDPQAVWRTQTQDWIMCRQRGAALSKNLVQKSV